jgi:predicted transcriptional regulator of viral defense system
MSTLLKPLQVREELLKRHIRIFSPYEFGRLFRTPAYTTKYFLEEQVRQGLFVRLKKGVYALKTDLPSEEEIANALYKPSYISFEYALAYYNMLPEMPYNITCATTKPTRVFTTASLSFGYYTIKKEAYTGYSLVKSDIKSFLIADPEKALVDYIYFETLGKRPHNDRLMLKNIDKEKLMHYARLYQRKSLINCVKDI